MHQLQYTAYNFCQQHEAYYTYEGDAHKLCNLSRNHSTVTDSRLTLSHQISLWAMPSITSGNQPCSKIWHYYWYHPTA